MIWPTWVTRCERRRHRRGQQGEPRRDGGCRVGVLRPGEHGQRTEARDRHQRDTEHRNTGAPNAAAKGRKCSPTTATIQGRDRPGRSAASSAAVPTRMATTIATTLTR